MTGELLAIVHAEERAETIVKQAQERKARALEDAIAERERRLSSVREPPSKNVTVRAKSPSLERIRRIAKERMKDAVAHILEEFHAQA